jgi:hypothetical protein
MNFAGFPVIITTAATEKRRPREPITDDMRAMVDEFWRRGLVVIRRVPCAYRMAGTLFVHPVVYDVMKREIALR